MTMNNDWDAAEDEYMQKERERLGGPPTPQEVVAFLRGEMPPADAARVRALLVHYPGLTDLLTDAVPADEPAVVSRKELMHRWESLQPTRPRFRVVRRLLPLAAMLVVGFLAGSLVQPFRRDVPRTFDMPHELHPLGERRSPAQQHAHPLSADEQNYLLVLMLAQETNDREYRVDLVDAGVTPPRLLWRASGVHRVANRPFAISIPRRFLDRGFYRLELYGIDGAPRHLASYAIRVVP